MLTPEQRSEYNRKYYENNKERILYDLKKKIKCECGRVVAYGNYLNHLDTNIHKKRIQLKDSWVDE